MFDIDDIYTAATEQEYARLEEMLKSGEVDLNQMVDAGVNAGVRTKLPALYSIIGEMVDNDRIDYRALDLLVYYGMDLNAAVVLSCDAYAYRIPVLIYIVKTWESAELLEYFLKRGANPNVAQVENYADGHMEQFSALYYAICECEDAALLSILLKYGADPNWLICVFEEEEAQQQLLLPLFYALIIEENYEKTRMLLQYGAKLYETMDLGPGETMPFDQYVARVYPGYRNVLAQAQREASAYPMQPVKVVKPQTVKVTPAAAAPAVQSQPEPKQEPVKQESDMDRIRKAAVELIRYDYEKYAFYRQCVSDSVVKPGSIFTQKKRKAEAEAAAQAAESILKMRESKIKMLNAQNAGNENINAWWNAYNWFEKAPRGYKDLVWMPFNRIADQGYPMLTSMFEVENETLSGDAVQKILKAAKTEAVFCTELSADAGYKIAEACLWEIRDGALVYEQSASEQSIQADLAAYREKLDDKERFVNMLDGAYETDEDHYLFGKMSDTTFIYNQLSRQEKMTKYEKQLRAATTTVAEDVDAYYQTITPMGIVVFDEQGKVAAASIYTELLPQEVYKVNTYKKIFDLCREKSGYSLESVREIVVGGLSYFPMPQLDPLSFAPDNISAEDWLKLIYVTNRGTGFADLQEKVKNSYQRAGLAKEQNLAY